MYFPEKVLKQAKPGLKIFLSFDSSSGKLYCQSLDFEFSESFGSRSVS